MVGLLRNLFSRFYGFVGFALLIVGLSGVPGDIDEWYNWISAMVENPTVQVLAEFAADSAQLINEPVVRVLLGLIGLAALAWPMKRFLRIRYKFKIWGKSIMSEKVWISQSEAVQEIRGSYWAELKEPYVSETRSLIDGSALFNTLNQKHTISGMSPEKKAQRKFKLFLEATLRSFQRNNPDAAKQVEEGKTETELNALRAFLQEALDQEYSMKWGEFRTSK
jgi:hypothetical protein